MKKNRATLRLFLCLLGIGFSAVLVGCQTAGKQVSTEKGGPCMHCETQVRTAAIKGLTYREHLCTVCNKLPDSHLWAEAPELSAPVGDRDCQTIGALCKACADDSFPVRTEVSANAVGKR